MKIIYNSFPAAKRLFTICLLFLLFSFSKTNAQYCNTGLGGAGCGTDQITGVEIFGTTLVNLNNTCTSVAGNTLTVFPDSGNMTADLMQGVTYDLRITTGANNIISVWIDYDQDTTFSTSEWTQVCTTSVVGGTTSILITIPFTATVGTTGMRIRSRGVNNPNGPGDACTNFGSGEAEDYTIHIIAAPPCTGTPVSGSAIGSGSVCPNINFSLNLQGNTLAAGLTYQWQSSPDSVIWTSITAGTTIPYITSQNNNTFYRCIVTCATASDTSDAIKILTNSFFSCYCSSGATSTADDDIGNVTFGSLNNGIDVPATQNPTAVNTYTDFTSLPVQTYLQGLTYPISISQINQAGFYATTTAVFIDFNQDGQYDPATEIVFTGQTNSATGGNIITGTVTIPLTSLPGNTGMRVVMVEGTTTPNPCGTYTWGETEDYTINIQAAVACVAPPTAGTATASQTAVCPSIPVNFNLQGSSVASGLVYQWQSSPTNSNFTNIAGATSINYTTSINANTYFRCVVSCNGVADTSSSVLVNVNSFTNCYCTSAATSTGDDDIGNVTFGALNNGVGTPATTNAASVNTYSDFTNLPAQTYLQGLSYPIEVTQINLNGFYTCGIAVFIDYDHNGSFDPATETIFSGQTNSAQGGNTITGNVIIPLTSTAGITRMRVVLTEGSVTPNPCGTYTWGETEDYLVNIQAAVPCVAPPTAGTATSSVTNVCPGINFNLGLTGSSIAAGLTYQWQLSSNNINFTDIAGATAINYSTTQNSNTYYRCVIFCNSVADTSSSVFVTTNNFISCYCTSASNSTVDDDIGNVTFGSLNNGIGTPALSNPASVNTYSNFTNLPATIFLQGLSYPISVTQINSSATFYSCYLTVFIDYDHNGIFDPNELIFDGQTVAGQGGNELAGNVTIPLTSTPGVTLMRLVLREFGSITQSPCGNYGYGETEDYLVDIIPAPPCVAPPAAGTAMASDSTVCPNVNFNLSLQGSALASGLSYQWESSPDNITWTPISGATTLYYQISQTSSTYYRCNVYCNSIGTVSAPLLVTLNSFVSCYCTSFSTSTTGGDIGNVTLGGLNNGIATPVANNPLAIETYTDYTNLGAINLTKNIYHPISVSQISQAGIVSSRVAAFIDMDHDGIFDPSGEIVFGGQTQNGSLNNIVIDSIFIPSTALNGVTRMRIILEQGNNIPDPCGSYFTGETEDYLINILNDSPCTVPFTVGITETSMPEVCSTDIFALSLPNLSADTGYSFQWQSSFDNILWTNISGATNQFFNGSQNFPTYYRCNVVCSAGIGVVSSTEVFIDKKTLSQCSYCNNVINGNCGINYYIDSVAIGGTTFNNANTGCAANAGFAFSKYPANGNTTTILGAGNYYDLYVKTAGSCNLSVWVDYDQSGTFDSNEWIQVSAATDSAVSTTIPLVLPDSAKLGVTGMRVRSRKSGNQNLSGDACSTYGSGETEDYFITIVSAISTGKELANDKNIRIFPNPSTGVISLEYRSEETKTLQVKLMNMEGQQLFTDNKDKFKGTYQHKLDLSNYPKGIYFVQFVSDSKISTKKIVIQ